MNQKKRRYEDPPISHHFHVQPIEKEFRDTFYQHYKNRLQSRSSILTHTSFQTIMDHQTNTQE